MAVQQNKKSPSRRGMRRAQLPQATKPTLATDRQTGDTHLRHHISANGYYRGRQIVQPVATPDNVAEEA